jgi:isoleucyl-tRNA synthetase
LDKSAAYWTLWTCLVELTKLLAPFAPFLAESLYRNLVSELNPSAPESVHLTDFPQGDPDIVDSRLAAGMAAARELASLGRSARTSAGVKVRQPLGHAVLLVPEEFQDAVEEIADLLAEELNVQEMSFAEDTSDLVRLTLRPNFAVAGPELGPKVRELAKALGALTDEAASELALTLEDGLDAEIDLGSGETLSLQPDHVDMRREPAEGTAFAYEAPFGISLNLEVSDELRREGLAREFVHQAQMARRDASLEVTDRIDLTVSAQGEALEALKEFEPYIAEELLATSLEFEASAPEGGRRLDVDGTDVVISLRTS